MTLALGVLLYDGVDELDALGPARVFWALDDIRPHVGPFDDVAVHLVAETVQPVAGSHGLAITPTDTYASCPPLDVLVVTGGGSDRGETGGRRFQQRHDPTLAFLREQTGLLSSVCTGAFLLAASGRLDGREASTHWTARKELSREFPNTSVVDQRLVDTGDVVTAGGVTSGIDLALHLVGRLLGPDVRGAVELALEIRTPSRAHH